MEWKDITSYSANNKERKPTSWEATSGALRVVITNNHVYCKGEWVMHCYKLGIDTHALKKGLNLEQAKQQAIATVKKVIDKLKQDAEALE